MIDAARFVQTMEHRQGLITAEGLKRRAEPLRKNDYGNYLLRVAEGL